jgi:hypothetical protein
LPVPASETLAFLAGLIPFNQGIVSSSLPQTKAPRGAGLLFYGLFALIEQAFSLLNKA